MPYQLDNFTHCETFLPDQIGSATAPTALHVSTVRFADGTEQASAGITVENVQSDWSQTDQHSDSFIQNKPTVHDWTTDLGDVNIDANNIPLLNYAPNTLASNGAPGLSNFNFNQTRKLKLDSIANGAEVNVQSNWNETDANSVSFIQNKPTLFSGNYADLSNTPTNLATTNQVALKQDSLALQNNSVNALDTSQVGSLAFGTGSDANKLIYTPATPIVTVTTHLAPLNNAALTGTPTLNGSQIKVNVGDGALTEKNFTTQLKHKLDGISDNADVTPSWVPASNPNYLTSGQAPLEQPVVATPSGTGNLTLTSNSGYNTRLTYTPPVIPTYTNGSNMTLNGTEFNIPQSVATSASPTFSNLNPNGIITFANSSTGSRKAEIRGVILANHAGQPQTNLRLQMSNVEVFSIYWDAQNTYYCWTGYRMYANAFTATSDDRIKSNEKPITQGVSVIEQLQPKIYDKHQDYRVPADKEDNDLTDVDYKRESGFIAQEVDKITELQHLVGYNESHDLYTLNYTGIIPYLVQSIKELNSRIKVLESQ